MMKRWHGTLYYVAMLLWPSENANPGKNLLPGKNILNIIPEFLAQSVTEPAQTTALVNARDFTEPVFLEDVLLKTASIAPLDTQKISYFEWYNITCLAQRYFPETMDRFPGNEGISPPYGFSHPPYGRPWSNYDRGPDPPDLLHPVQYAGKVRELQVYTLPLKGSDNELKLNVTWLPSLGSTAQDFSLEVRSVTNTLDCNTPMCYEYNIPGDSTWWLVPAFTNHVAETCAVRPGCAYKIIVTAHPWDGRTVADKLVQLDECEAGVCSCAHSPRLPTPAVTAQTVSQDGELYANISWTLPVPRYPQRLPRGLGKENYFVSIGKQMVTDAHPSPWFANTITRRVDADGPVAAGDGLRWILLPIDERSGERVVKQTRPDVKLLARVTLADERGCFGPAGNATAYDPDEENKVSYRTFALWAIFGGIIVLFMVLILAVSARAVKRILNALRPPSASAPLEPLRRRPAWLPLVLRS